MTTTPPALAEREPAAGDLPGRAVRGGLVTAAGTWLRFVLQLGTVVVVARLLGPTEYGAAALVLVVALAAELIRTSGVATVTIQARTLDDALASSLHWLNAGLGVLVGTVVTVVCTVTDVLPATLAGTGWMLGVVFVAAGFGAVPAARMNRALEFRFLAVAEVAAMVAGCATALVLAADGFGARALVWQSLVFAVVLCLVVTVAARWRPSRPAPWATTAVALRSAGNALTVQLLNFATRNVDKLIVGAAFGPTATGLYAQASQLLVLPLEQINGPLQRVAIPVLSRVSTERERFARYYREIVSVVGFVLWPLFAVLAVLAVPLVVAVFGTEWEPSASIFQILVIAGFAQTLGYVNVWLFIATGRFGRQTAWAFITRPIVLASFFVGLPWGVHGMALSYSICSLVMVVPGFLAATRGTAIGPRDLLAPLPWPVLVAVVSALAAGAVSALVPGGHWAQVILGGLAALVVYGLAMTLLPGPRRTVSRIRTLVRHRSDPISTPDPEDAP